MQGVVLDTCRKLVAHLRSHERVGDAVLLKILVEGDEVQTQFLGHNIDGCSAGERRVRIHHVGVKAVAGIGRNLAPCLEVKHLMVPVAEGHKIGVGKLAALWHTCRTRCVKQDKQLVGLDVHLGRCSSGQVHDILGQQHLALVLVNDGTQFLVSDQQLGAGILHHEVQALLGITRVERLIAATGLERTQRGDRHPLAAGNDDRHHVFGTQALADDIGGNAVADFINLGIGELLVHIYDGCCVGRGLGLLAEQRDDGLTVVIFQFARVKAVEGSHLVGCGNVDVAQVFLGDEALEHGLIAL